MTRGVSPKELNAFMVQRLRWAVGAIQILLAGNPLFVAGLPLRARWLYFWSTIGIVAVVPLCLMGLIMYGTILAGAGVPFGPASFEQYLAYGGTTVVLMMVMQSLAGWRLNSREYLRALQVCLYSFLMCIDISICLYTMCIGNGIHRVI
jgi:cellulose synthase/poly-beta-1,6-N-acetylglucosamine synthase-like glycosyltransferase